MEVVIGRCCPTTLKGAFGSTICPTRLRSRGTTWYSATIAKRERKKRRSGRRKGEERLPLGASFDFCNAMLCGWRMCGARDRVLTPDLRSGNGGAIGGGLNVTFVLPSDVAAKLGRSVACGLRIGGSSRR